MKIRVTADFEVKEEDKYTVCAAIEKEAAEMGLKVAEVGSGCVIGDSKISFPRGPKTPAKKAK